MIVPRTVKTHISGLGAHAREVTRTQSSMAKIPAAAGGILRSRLFGSPAKPRLAMIVGMYQLSAYVARFMSVWSSRKAQVVGALKAVKASFLSQLLSAVAGALAGSLASRNCCSRGVSQELLLGLLGKSGSTQKMTPASKTVATPSRMKVHLQPLNLCIPSMKLVP